MMGALLAKPALNRLRMKTDPRRYNGAMMLGLNGICVKSHGGTDVFGFANAIDVAVGLVSNSINESIKEDYARIKLDQSDRQEQAANE